MGPVTDHVLDRRAVKAESAHGGMAASVFVKEDRRKDVPSQVFVDWDEFVKLAPTPRGRPRAISDEKLDAMSKLPQPPDDDDDDNEMYVWLRGGA